MLALRERARPLDAAMRPRVVALYAAMLHGIAVYTYPGCDIRLVARRAMQDWEQLWRDVTPLVGPAEAARLRDVELTYEQANVWHAVMQ